MYTNENLMLFCDSLRSHAHDTGGELKPVSDSKPVDAHTIKHSSMNIHATRNLLNWREWNLHQILKFQVD